MAGGEEGVKRLSAVDAIDGTANPFGIAPATLNDLNEVRFFTAAAWQSQLQSHPASQATAKHMPALSSAAPPCPSAMPWTQNKDMEALQRLGGVEGLAQALLTDLMGGLNPATDEKAVQSQRCGGHGVNERVC